MSRSTQVTVLIAALLACACSSEAGEPPSGAAGGGGESGSSGGESGSDSGLLGSVELGIPGGPDSLDFAPLEEGAVLKLETFGQGGTHVLLGVRCVGFGQRAFVSLHVRNLVEGTELDAPAPARPQLLFCEGEVCDLVPITMMMGGIAANDAERDGLPIEISAEVHNVAGVTGSASARATLSTADL
ncbi:MAG TPA: hypothetical protein VER11_19930 [Polyangiaceae bacterium]|nr:hypothetical protein [Polyangiaceae bacterium]